MRGGSRGTASNMTLRSALQADLLENVAAEIRFDPQARSAWSTDASNFRQIPQAVVVPHDVQAALTAAEICHRHHAPVVSRGGGTSLAGQCTNDAVMIDFSAYCNRLLSVDEGRRTCVVEPGIVLDSLNQQLEETGLRWGPEPATHMNCTVGGMLGNNSCGATAQRTGKAADNVQALDVMLYDGTRFRCGPTDDRLYAEIERAGNRQAAIYRSLRRLRDEHADLIRKRFPDIPRRVSGYNLDALLPENGFDLAKLLVGSEGTLATIASAELRLVDVVRHKAVAMLGFPDIVAAARAVPHVLEHEPIALEGLDHYLLHDERVKHMNSAAFRDLPKGDAFLLVEFGGDDPEEARHRAQELVRSITGGDLVDADVSDDPERAKQIWSVRESGLGATAHFPGGPDTYPGWEDSAVAPDQLAPYLSHLQELFDEFRFTSEAGPSVYGHFGQGCVHVSIPFQFSSPERIATYRRFVERAADLVVSFGGSLSGEHGDGQARGELLERMFGPEVVGLFAEVKALFDPDNGLNPGKVVNPRRLDSSLRLGHWTPDEPGGLHFAYEADGGSFAHAVNRCVGIGKCRVGEPSEGVMCPSYQVTRAEEQSTRGRSRLLFEMLNGHEDGLIQDGWRSREVHDALDLCLACKGCKSDCPADVDMATYKAEFMAHYYAHRLRPRADYATGWLPDLAARVRRQHLTRAVNTLGGFAPLRRLGTRLAGLENRPLPRFADRSLQEAWAVMGEGRSRLDADRRWVVLWPDTFTNHFTPEVGDAAIRVLTDAGWDVEVPSAQVCCGLTWISTGQLSVAKKRLRHAVSVLTPYVSLGARVVVLEPSCASVFRSDAAELFPDDPEVKEVGEAVVTLAELLNDHTPHWTPPSNAALADRTALAQVHCHQHAVLGWDADREVLDRLGLDAQRMPSGCCGLAGNFGITRGHGEVSEACAEQEMLPRIRAADPSALVLADGFSCRKQINDLDNGGRRASHLAEVLAAALDPDPDATLAARPRRE